MNQVIAPVKNLLVIDSQVSNWQSLANAATADTAVLILDSGSDGLTQISNYLTTLAASTQYFVPLQSLQIISHGSAGSLLLGSSTVTTGSLKQYSSQLASIGNSLTATGDILLYGCNVAETPLGLDFINLFSTLTRADVAASTDLTGATALGGNWVLEAATGTIEATVLQPVYNGLLLDISGTALADTLVGTSGDDIISGYGGNDTIDGQAGNDTLYGGEGDDTLTDGQGSNWLDGGVGSDNLTSRSLSGQHTLLGGTGNDWLFATGLVVNLDGGEGADNLSANGILSGSIYSLDNSTYVLGGTATLSGGTGNDSLDVQYYRTAFLEGGDGNDYLSTLSDDSDTLSGGAGADTLSVNFDVFWMHTDPSTRANIHAYTYVLDGGADNDNLSVSGSGEVYYGQVTTTLRGGSGDDSLSVTDYYAGVPGTGRDGYIEHFGIAFASLDGGEGNDQLTASGVVQLSLTGGVGVDSFILTIQQYLTLLEGTRNFKNSDGSTTAVTANPTLITDFAVGVGGDVLDYSALLRNRALTYDGSNPFSNGFLSLVQSGADTLLKFDEDGAAGAAGSPVVIARLQNVTATSLISANFNPNYPPDGSPAVTQLIKGDELANTLVGGFGNDTIYGYGSNDTINGQAGNDTLYGGEGDDTIEGGFGNDNLYGENGNDTLTDNQGANRLDGGAGNDILSASSLFGNYTLLGGSGRDQLYATGLVVNLDGGEQNDTLSATGSLDNDNVVGGTATLSGGTGNDSLEVTNYRTASLEGGDGNDSLSINDVSSATLSGGAGTDTLSVNAYNGWSDTRAEGARLAESYVLDGGADNDNLSIIVYSQVVWGQTTVSLLGGSGDDNLTVKEFWAGYNGDTSDTSGIASASLDGGEGNDNLTAGGVLHLSMTGGAGVDSFILTAKQYYTLLQGTRNFQNSDGSTTAVTADPTIITDFTVGVGGDVLYYSDLLINAALTYDGINPYGNGFLSLVQSGADTLLTFDADGAAGVAASPVVIARLQNVTASTLLASNFNPNFNLHVNQAPTLTSFASTVATGNEDSQIAVTFANLQIQGNEADVDGTVTAFIIKAVSTGSLKIGTSAATATAWNASSNNTVDTTNQAFWTPAANANGTLNAFTAVAKDNGGVESATAIQAKVAVTPVNDTPTGSVTISGTATQNQILTATNTLADVDGLGTIAYQWLANGTAISGATAATLTLGQAQVGKTITVKAAYTDLLGTAENVISAATLAVVNVNDAPTGTVTITGNATQNQTLTAANTLADVDGLGTIAYQWLANGTAISGATASTLTLGQAQVGQTITVKAAYTDQQGTNESVTSLATAPTGSVTTIPVVTLTTGITPVEGASGSFIVTLDSLAPAGGLTINYKVSGTATLNTDYTVSAGANITAVTAGSFTIAAGQTTANLTINAVYDGIADPNETIKLSLSQGTGYQFSYPAAFDPKVDVATGSYPNSVSVGDFNGDGKTDLAVTNYSIDFQKLNFQNPSKIHKNRNKTRLKYTHLQSL